MIAFLGLLGIFCVYIVLKCYAAYWVFKPTRKYWPLQLPFEPISYHHTTGIYLPARPGSPTILFFHGRGLNVSHCEPFAKHYAALGYGLFLCDYQGFGLSTGKPSQKAVQQDALNALEYLLNVKKISPSSLIVYGHSLGNAPALYAAHHTPIRALILQSPFLSTPDVAASWATHTYQPHAFLYRFYKALVRPFLWGNPFENTLLTRGLTCPVLICMSKQDTILPWQQSAQLANLLSHAKRFLSPKGGHDEFSWPGQAVQFFLKEISYNEKTN